MNCGKALVLVVDDDGLFVSFLTETLREAGFDVLEAATGVQGLELARVQRPAVALVDVNLTDISGYEVCRRLRADFGEQIGIIFLSGSRAEAFDRAAGILLGADDYVVKPFDPGELVARILRLVARIGVTTVEPRSGEALAELTAREMEILGLLAAGSDQETIAHELVISPKTVGTHIQRILSKLGVHSRAQAIVIAHQSGLLDREVVAHLLTTTL